MTKDTSLIEYHQYASALVDSSVSDDDRLKFVQEISQCFETICSSNHYAGFLEHAIPKFLSFLKESEAYFSTDSVKQELRKLLLDIIHRIPANDSLKTHVSSILDVMFHMLNIDNEENVLVALRIIIELHKQFRPQIKPEIKMFLQFVINFYKEFHNIAKTHFDIVAVTATGHLPIESTINSQNSMKQATVTAKVPSSPVGQPSDNSARTGQIVLIPKATESLKVLAELPIIVVLMYQLYKQSVQGKIEEFIPVVMKTITLQPSLSARSSPLFNKEVYVDFTAAQIKTLSFLAYNVKIFQDLVGQYSTNMVAGMLALFRYCPQEVAHLRKELLIAVRHILATELRSKFVPHIEQFFDEDVLIGSGWTVNEALRPLAYSTLADFVHHVRQVLTLPNLSMAVQLFSKNVYDESLPLSIQRMSCKLLLNLVECIRQKSEESSVNGREILMKMLEVFVRKFQTIAKYHIPGIMNKCEPAIEPPVGKEISNFPPSPSIKDDDIDEDSKKCTGTAKDSFSVPDYREMVKTLVCGVKTITWGAGSCKLPGDITISVYPQGNKVFLPSETEIFIRLLKYALVALDVYQISINPTGTGYVKMTNSPNQIRMKEEKEILEHFAGVFTMLNTATFKEVFSASIDYLVERIHNNYAFQIIPNSFLANPHTSATFATILVDFLLGKLKDMGTKSERANLYLKLFKLVFGSVSLFAQENEQMLKPHLHDIVNNSMELALSAKEPYNYFLLLRALFRSIGGGNHDLLYQEFLPLLPALLQGLNNLQSGVHKQHMKDLFVELCLTVPVRLSSLLPYLPMLMDPLVSALNGSQSLVSQGLRTLELCVDNLQPDFLYDHILPVKSDLMQALWKTLRNPMETMAHVAFRVLGKFGGNGRKLLEQPQTLNFRPNENIGPCLMLYFTETNEPVNLPVSVVIDKALSVLKTQIPSLPSVTQNNYSVDNIPFYKEQAWFIIKHFIVAAISKEDSTLLLKILLKDVNLKDFPKIGKMPVQSSMDEQSKKTFQQALTGMLFASSIKELQNDSLPFMCGILRQFALVMIVQQSELFYKQQNACIIGMDVHTIVDSIADIVSHEDKDLTKYGNLAITVLFETASIVMQDKLKAAQLPFFEYLAEKLCGCCYERAWFAKSGGCSVVEFLMNTFPIEWVVEHQPMFISALMFVMMDLLNEVSSGAVESAKRILEELLRKCNGQSLKVGSLQDQYFPIVVQNMVREVVSPNHTVREQARHSLQVLSEVTNKTVYSLMEPHKSLLEDMIPPKKHLLRHQPINTQIALMDGNTFCTSLNPRLFTMDLSIVEHKVFFTELYTLCEADDATLTKLPCYKSVTSFTQLRVSALAALTACHYIVQAREKIFNVLVKAINSISSEVMQAGKENMQKFIAGGALESVKELVSVNIRPLLLMLGDYRSLSMNVLNKLTCFMELFPELFNEKLCEQLLAHLRKWTDTAVSTANTQNHQQVKPALRSTEEIKICGAIMNMFYLVPAASTKLIEPLIALTVKTERALVIEVSSPFRQPLVAFLLHYPHQAVEHFLSNISDPLINRLFICILKRDDAKPFRIALEANAVRLVNCTFLATLPQQNEDQLALAIKRHNLQFQGVLIVRILVKFNPEWLSQQPLVITHLKRIWNSHPLFEKSIDSSNEYWREVKLVAKCLLSYVSHKPNDIDVLFQLLKVYTIISLSSFHFLKRFLENICKSYTVEKKRNVFFKFVECFLNQSFPQTLKAMILMHLVIPMFEDSFKKNETIELIGGPPCPEQDSPNNVISVFLNKVIDPEMAFPDSIRILLLQLSALLVEHAGAHIHDVSNRKQGVKLKRLYIFAWPCLLSKQCVDPATKYHGFFLQAHIIIKFAIHKKFVLQVFHGLLKAHGQEARQVVRQGLDILTPVMPTRMEDGNAMLSHWTKKIIVEEGHTLSQLVHVLHLIVHHHDVYYPVRMDLVQHMISSMQRLGFTQSATIEHRKLAVDLAEVIIEWERHHNEQDQTADVSTNLVASGIKRLSTESVDQIIPKKPRTMLIKEEKHEKFEKHVVDAVSNFLFRIACQVNDNSASTGSSPAETLSKRCFKLLQICLKPDCWPEAELRVIWLEKLFLMLESTPNSNISNISIGLEMLTYMCTILNKQEILAMFKPIQRGIIVCMACQNAKVVKGVHLMLEKLLGLFPIESGFGNKEDEFENLYTSIGNTIYEGLNSYETSSSTTTLNVPINLLKAACSSSPCYLDKFLIPFMKAMQKMQKEHITGQAGESAGLTDLLISALELAKIRVCAMQGDMRKVFLTVLTSLIEKSPEARLLKAMIKIVDEWIRVKITTSTNIPSIREKSLILYRMMLNFEKRFADDVELHSQFLEIVNYVYKDKSLSGSELTARLEPAFLAGLRSVNPSIRTKFMDVFDKSIKKKIYDRLLYIISTQNWEHMGNQYWIKQCLELIFNTIQIDKNVVCNSNYSRLPSCLSALRNSNQPEAVKILEQYYQQKKDLSVTLKSSEQNYEEMKNEEIDFFCLRSTNSILEKFNDINSCVVNLDNKTDYTFVLEQLSQVHGKFLDRLHDIKIAPFVNAIAQLCHRSTLLAHKIWVDIFPQLWDLLETRYQTVLCGEFGPFLCSGSHLAQTEGYRSAINTLVEGMSRCVGLSIRPCVLKYLGKTHNLWHQSALMLENMALACDDIVSVNPQLPLQQPWLDFGLYDDDVSEIPVQETFESLAEMYELLSEDDMVAGLWQHKARFPETLTALSFELQGLFEHAQTSYESAMSKAREQSNNSRLDPRLLSEYQLWEDRWVRCAKELGQWDVLIEFGKSKAQSNDLIVLESAWRIPDWQAMKEALTQVELSFPDAIAYQLTLYRGYLSICHPDEQNLSNLEKLVDAASTQAIRQWRRLPNIVSSIHIKILRAAQQIIELQEASQLHVGLQQQNIGRMSSLHDMKATVKTWRNRLPLQCDDLLHWSDIFMWRHHHYQAIVAAYENLSTQMSNEAQSNNHAMLGVHASAWSIIYYGYIARKHGLTGVCLDSLSRIHTIPSVPIVDCFQKIRQQVKCYLQMAGVMGKTELHEGLEVIESTNLKYFTKEMTAEFHALKGMFLAQVGRSEEANKAFSDAVQMHDTLVKAWALWGDYLDSLFVSDRNMTLGVYALICYLHACRSNHEAKCRKYLARSLWLLTYDDDKAILADTLEKYYIGVHPAHWLAWIPQLLTCLVRKEGQRVLNLIFSIGRVFPQAVYFPIRTLYLTLKIEQREKYKLGLVQGGKTSPGFPSGPSGMNVVSTSNEDETITKTVPSSVSESVVDESSSVNTIPTSSDVVTPATIAARLAASSNTVNCTIAPSSLSNISTLTTEASDKLSTSKTASTHINTTSTTASEASSATSANGSGGLIRAPPQMWRCSRIMHMLRDLHPTLLSALEGIVDQMVWFRECWHEDVLRQLRQGLAKCYQVAFEQRGNINNAQITPRTLSFVNKLVSTFGIGFESASNISQTFSSAASESLARRAQITAQDPVFQKLKGQFSADFDFSQPNSKKLHVLIMKLKKWIKILEAKAKVMPSSFLLEETCRFISNFSQSTAEVELPGEFLMPKATTHNAFYVRISKFMPRVELVQRNNFSARRLTIRGHNGKLYPYLVVNDAWLTESRREERVLQLMRMLNHFFEKRKETCRRGLQFTVPRVVAVSPQMRLIEDNPSFISLNEIFKEGCEKRNLDSEHPIVVYYEKLAQIQERGYIFNHQSLREILKEVQTCFVPETMFKEWALYTYPTATEYWTFRKKLTQQIALAGLIEFVLHLTRLNPEMINIARDCGKVTFNYFRFDIDDIKGELDANRPVPFRLTPNLSEFITPVGINGIMTHCMIAVARCLVQPQFSISSYFKVILKDELIAWNKKKQDEQNLLPNQSEMNNEQLITLVTNASNAMLTRLQNLAIFENAESKVFTLISAALNSDNTCRMDPAWHPWL
ncbi:transformation/transcription domain-associated protein isoform X3 [Hydra vulgaris]|uniref:Transformation/transcription domain-associated protein isoform X3 n=1 Tax=Hydra vulgaris TaxID=6087 RepID=A0ABM4CY17_HYDVU